MERPEELHGRTRADAMLSSGSTSSPASTSSASMTESEDAVDEKQRKRLKHREYVKKSYQKKINTINSLKTELDTLEKQYNALLISHAGVSTLSPPAPSDPALLRRYMELTQLKTQYQKENAALYALNAEFMKAESRVQQLLDAEASAEMFEVPVPTPRFQFESLPASEYAKIIASARDDILKFANDSKKLTTGSRVFGWTDQRKVAGEELKFALEKVFPISAYDLLARSWPIFSTPERFSLIYSSTLHTTFHVLQHINDDTILLFRTVRVDGSDFVAKTVFLLARIRIDQGYMLLFRSVDRELVKFVEVAPQQPLAIDLHKDVWVSKYTWVIFRETGPDACLFHFGGSTTTNIWLKEVLFIALKWENMAVGPQITLQM